MLPLQARMADALTMLPTVYVVVLEMKTFLLLKKFPPINEVPHILLYCMCHEDKIAQLICERMKLYVVVEDLGLQGLTKFFNCDVLNVKGLICIYIILLINYIRNCVFIYPNYLV
jgi:hypothetical protein